MNATRRELIMQAREALRHTNCAHVAVVDIITCAINEHREALEYQDNTTEMLREQGCVRALRQLLNDISPKTGR